MATKGRKPKPNALKILEGNPGKRPIGEELIKAPPDDFDCPSWLNRYAKEEWARLAPALRAQGVLTMLDVNAFAAYCEAYARWRDAEEHIEKYGATFETPSGYIQQTPYVAIANKAIKDMQSFCNEFGLTPASRARILAASDSKSSQEDPMEQLLTGTW